MLLVAAIHWANGNGEFHPTKRTWAEKARVGESVVDRAVRTAQSVGLLDSSAFTRPSGRSGSNVYRFDPNLIGAAKTQPPLVVQADVNGVQSCHP